MTLIVAINLNNYIFLASDQRLTFECAPSTGLPTHIYQDGYSKIQYWQYGAIVMSGDVFLMDFFYQALISSAKSNDHNLDVIYIAQVALAAYLHLFLKPKQIFGCAFFSIFTSEGMEIIHLSISDNVIKYETIEPMHAHFSLFAGSPNDPIYQQLVNCLRNDKSFENFKDFYHYHAELLKYFFKRQRSFDESITSTFDLFIQNKKNGKGFTQIIDN